MALAASCQACRWSAWTREIVTFEAPAHAVVELTNLTHESNTGRRGDIPAGQVPAGQKAGPEQTFRHVSFRTSDAGGHHDQCT
jgi:hypothetical protein